MSQQKQCFFCKGEISRFERTPDGKMKKWNMDGSPHTYDQCKAKQSGQQVPPATVAIPQQQPPTQENVQLSRLLFSQENKINAQGKKIDDFSKRLEQLIELVEEMYQQNTLIIKQTGYPKPEPLKEYSKQVLEKAVQESEEKEEFPQYNINNTLEAETVNNFKEEFSDEKKNELVGQVLQEEKPAIEIVDGWTVISQRFECHSCEKITQNGYERYSTMLCPECRKQMAEVEEHHKE